MNGAYQSLRVFGGPQRYFQGPGALDILPQVCAELSDRIAIVADADVLDMLGGRLDRLLLGLPHSIVPFRGEITAPAMDAIAELVRAENAGVVAGVGGGKALDAGKGVAARTDARFVSVPTIASNDSPTSMSLAVYDEGHRMVAIEPLGRSPDAVVVDTQVIAAAPRHFLLAGIGDAIAKKFEGEASQAARGLNAHYAQQSVTAAYIADGCYRTIRASAADALAVAGTGQPNDAFEALVEANILMSGLAFENMGLGLAHGLVRGLVRTPLVDKAAHGFHVAYGTLVQLAAEKRSDAFIDDVIEFYEQIGLPRSLRQLGLEAVDHDCLRLIAQSTTIAPEGAYLVVTYEAEQIVAAMEVIERRYSPD